MNPYSESIQNLLLRDLDVLEKEIKLYPNEDSLWAIEGDIKNPAGNLCLHLCGNLQHFIGTVLGSTGYVRQREKEFSDRNIPVSVLLQQIEATRQAIRNTLPKLDSAALESEYPVQVFGKPMTTLYFLLHLSAHLGYHLGQVNYHRRMSEVH